MLCSVSFSQRGGVEDWTSSGNGSSERKRLAFLLSYSLPENRASAPNRQIYEPGIRCSRFNGFLLDLTAPANATAFFSRAQSKRPIPKGGQGRSARHYSDMADMSDRRLLNGFSSHSDASCCTRFDSWDDCAITNITRNG